MRFSTILAALAPVVAVFGQQTINVMVGQGGLAYTPNSVEAKNGDTIQFTFAAKNHTVTQSTFAQPCQNMTTPTQGIDSGFLAVPAGATQLPQWSFTINNDTTPLWFYCRQSGHCQAGMVFAVNPTADKTFDKFLAAAKASSPNGGAAPSASGATAGGSSAAGASGGSAATATGSKPSTGTSTGTSTGAAASATQSSGAMRLGGTAAGALTVVGLVAGLIL